MQFVSPICCCVRTWDTHGIAGKSQEVSSCTKLYLCHAKKKWAKLQQVQVHGTTYCVNVQHKHTWATVSNNETALHQHSCRSWSWNNLSVDILFCAHRFGFLHKIKIASSTSRWCFDLPEHKTLNPCHHRFPHSPHSPPGGGRSMIDTGPCLPYLAVSFLLHHLGPLLCMNWRASPSSIVGLASALTQATCLVFLVVFLAQVSMHEGCLFTNVSAHVVQYEWPWFSVEGSFHVPPLISVTLK